MKRGSSVVLCCVVLLTGLVVGASLDSLRLIGNVQARAITPQEAETLYRELGAAANPLIEGSRLLNKVAMVTTPSVVHIQSEHRSSRRGSVEETGSGVIVRGERSPGHYVVTNRHVIASAELKDISIHLHDGRVLHPTNVLSDPATDIAVLQIEASGLHPARWGDSDQLEIGDMVLAMGSPFGLSQSVTWGIISAKGRRSLKLGTDSGVLNQDFLQTDAAINPGNSGGPLIDLQGRIIGINTAIASNSGGNEGIGFSIPSNLVQRVVNQLLTNGRVQRAYLGVKLDSKYDVQVAQRLKLDRARGARVVEVYPSTPASRANLQYDDVILTFDGVDVQDENHLINLVSLTPVGKRVKMFVWRNGARVELQVLLGDRSDLEQRSERSESLELPAPVIPMSFSARPLTPGLAAQIGVKPGAGGLLVLNVPADSPLFDQLQAGDVIEEVGGMDVSSLEDLQAAAAKHGVDAPLLLKVRRGRDGAEQPLLVIWERTGAESAD